MARPNYVDEAEVVSFSDYYVLCPIVPWKHEGSLPSNEEEDLFNLFVLEVDVLLLCVNLGFQDRAHPKYERHVTVFEELYLSISLLKDINGDFSLELVR